MKKFTGILVLSIVLILLNSCAKPTVVEVVVPGDDKLNCEQLKDAIVDAQANSLEYSDTASVLHEINNRIVVLENVYFENGEPIQKKSPIITNKHIPQLC